MKNKNILIIITYFLFNLFFFRSFWSEIFFDRSKVGMVYGEVFAVEWGLEKLYQNILNFKNPFSQTDGLLYPFGVNLVNTDSGNGFFFLLLRPFFSVHQSLAILTALSILAANLGMYLLLRKLNFDRVISFFIGLSFGYTTFLMPRVGHITYFSIYVFPWIYYFILSFFEESKDRNTFKKILAGLGFSFFFALSLYTNLYYFVIILISFSFFIIFFILFKRNIFVNKIRKNWKYLVAIFFFTFLFIFPWLMILLRTYMFDELPKVNGWGGSIQFSSDLFGYFIPSIYSFFLQPVANFIASKFSFANGIFENFSYPGILILISLILLGYYQVKKKLKKDFSEKVQPFFWVGFGFWILTLGPFLHVFGKWGLMVKDEILLVAPLPYVLFHYLPFMGNIRVPGRLVIGFIFFFYIVSAHVISLTLKKRSVRFKKIFFVLLFFLITIDQYFLIPNPEPKFFPNKIYETIKNDQDFGTVLEIPSTIRDGFIYFGDGDSIDFMVGQRIHGKPVLGGYFGRIPFYKINYYQKNPFLGYVGRLVDANLLVNGGLDKTDLEKWKNIDINESQKTIDFLDINYIILDSSKEYSASLSVTFEEMGYYQRLTENKMKLFHRNLENREFKTVKIGKNDDDMYIGMGWSPREDGYRWTGNKASVLFKLNNPRNLVLSFSAEPFYQNQPVAIFVNNQKLRSIEIINSVKNYSLEVDKIYLKKGINFVHFIFEKSYKPKDVLPGSLDERNLSAKFSEVSLSD